MASFRAVAVFPYIDPSNFDQFCALASQMMQVIRQQESILRYDMFFSDNNNYIFASYFIAFLFSFFYHPLFCLFCDV
jgi:hypothetical protein